MFADRSARAIALFVAASMLAVGCRGDDGATSPSVVGTVSESTVVASVPVTLPAASSVAADTATTDVTAVPPASIATSLPATATIPPILPIPPIQTTPPRLPTIQTIPRTTTATATTTTTPADPPDEATRPPTTNAPSAPPPAGSGLGSRQEPIPLGTPATIGDGWTITVNSVLFDAAAVVAAADSFNSPAPAGKQYIVINLTAAYDGPESVTRSGIEIKATGDGTNTVSDIGTSESFALPPAPAYDAFDDVSKGSSVTGNVVLEVPVADAASLVLIGETFLTVARDQRKFFAAR